MMQSEFVELTKIYPSETLYKEIEKKYMDSNMTKQDFCKAYKANKNGMAEAIARAASWAEDNKDRQENERLRRVINSLSDEIDFQKHNALEVTERLRKETERANKAETKIKEQELEIMKLKAKLYDMRVKGAE